MERINNSNTLTYSPMEVLKNIREPFNKNTLWIYPNKNNVEVKIFNNGWKTLFTTEDIGLSTLSQELVNKNIKSLREDLVNIVKKHLGKYYSNTLLLIDKEKKLELRIIELESKLDKLNKRYSTLLSKIKSNGK